MSRQPILAMKCESCGEFADHAVDGPFCEQNIKTKEKVALARAESKAELTQLRARVDEYEKALGEIECHVSGSMFGPCSCSQLIARAALEKGRK